MRRALLWLVVALLAGGGVAWLLQFGSGYILISYAGATVETGFWTGIILAALLNGLVIWAVLLVRWVIGAGGFRLWWAQRRSKRSVNKTAQGLLLYIEDQWHLASKVLAKSAARSSMPVVNLLFAARAAADDGDLERASELLQELREQHPQAAFLAGKAEAEFLLIEDEPEAALDILENLHREKPDSGAVLRLLADAYYLQGNWAQLERLLHDLRRYRAMPEKDLHNLELDVFPQLLLAFMPDGELSHSQQKQQLVTLWESIPKRLRSEPRLVEAYGEALLQQGASDQIEPLLVATLNRHWQAPLVELYGKLISKTPDKQLATAEKWYQAHGQDRALLLALGRICHRQKFYGKARDYLRSSLKIEPCAQAYLELAQVLEAMGENQESQRCYRQGLLYGLNLEEAL